MSLNLNEYEHIQRSTWCECCSSHHCLCDDFDDYREDKRGANMRKAAVRRYQIRNSVRNDPYEAAGMNPRDFFGGEF